ncbi:unnamed protein product [Phaedon cochleariae]|uniref:ENTH domain-containing protein n=1 Tax=Phaedon cochleariae TaxID=80249 RepID=A0A9N9X4A4_PHACE|nr:unnamed protein product [Phaedon cochleariae]
MAGQTINDRLLAAKHSLAGQGLAKSVCKATTEEMLGPKKKHLDYLVHCTNEPNVSIPQMANLLMERSQSTSWVVVYKALLTTHHVMCYGNERFTQYLASSNVSFQLSNFVDKTGVQSAVGARTGYDMSPFIRRYAKYLNEKALSYRLVAFDFCKVKRGKEEGTLRTMNSENLLKTLPILQGQLDALLEFDCTVNDLTNGVINMCFMLLFRDLIRLFACYNDGVINLLEKYFEMNKKQCREALDLYKKFLIRMDRVAEFLKVAENIGIDKGDIPDLAKAPNSLLDALEAHLASLEGNTPTAVTAHKSFKSGVSTLADTSNAFSSSLEGQNQASAFDQEIISTNYGLSSSPLASTNPFLSEEPLPKAEPILDFFDNTTSTTQQNSTSNTTTSALDDLLSLGGNPFADMPVQNGSTAPNFGLTGNGAPNSNMWATDGFTAPNAFQQQPFGQTADFTALMGANESSVFNPMFDPAKPMPVMNAKQAAPVQPQRPAQPSKLLTGDLESSLTSLVENLTMDTGKRGTQWSSPKNQPKSGNWQPQSTAPQAMFNSQPAMSQPMMPSAMQFQQPMGGSPKANVAPPQNVNSQATFDPFGAL